jgi:hypothetical protein
LVLEAVFPGVQWAAIEADSSPPCTAKVKNSWSYASTSPYIYMVWYLITHRDNFAFFNKFVMIY